MFSFIEKTLNKIALKGDLLKMHDDIVECYASFGILLGALISECYPTEPYLSWENRPEHMSKAFELLDKLEELYSSLGYKIIPLDAWIDAGGWDINIANLWLVKRPESEKPQFTKDQYIPEIIPNER